MLLEMHVVAPVSHTNGDLFSLAIVVVEGTLLVPRSRRYADSCWTIVDRIDGGGLGVLIIPRISGTSSLD